MDKRKLAAIPVEAATREMTDMAAGIKEKYLVTALVIANEKMLCLNFYDAEELRKRNPKARFRTFLSERDYITQDLSGRKVKWLTSSFENMKTFNVHPGYAHKEPTYGDVKTVRIRSEWEEKLIRDFFKDHEGEGRRWDWSAPWESVRRFQDAIIRQRLIKRHKKETDVIDAAMERVGEVPQNFHEWTWETGMGFCRYLIYKETKKNTAACKCTHCGTEGEVSRKKVYLRNDGNGTCPFCGSGVVFKAAGYMSFKSDSRIFAYVDPVSDGFVLRYFQAVQVIRREYGYEAERDIEEQARTFYSFKGETPEVTHYKWGVYKQKGNKRWCPGESFTTCNLYPGNLPQAWGHTPVKYSALEVLAGNFHKELDYENAIVIHMKFTWLEWLCKMGLNNLAAEVVQCGIRKMKNPDGKTIYEILGLNKINTRILQEIDGDSRHIRILHAAQAAGLQFKSEQVKEYVEIFDIGVRALKHKTASIHKLLKYITKESEAFGQCPPGRAYSKEKQRIAQKRNMAQDWLEYLDWCRELKYDLKNKHIYMPRNFKRVHDRVAKEIRALRNEKAMEEKKRMEEAFQNQMAQARGLLAESFKAAEGEGVFYVRGRGMVLMVPKTDRDVQDEGNALNHCVGGYLKQVAEGETVILFIRKRESPDKSYYTMELKNGEVKQCRGLNNCVMTPEVKAYVEAFQKKLGATLKKKEKTDNAGKRTNLRSA